LICGLIVALVRYRRRMKIAKVILGTGVLIMALAGVGLAGVPTGMAGLVATIVGGFGLAIAMEEHDLAVDLRPAVTAEEPQSTSTLV
jgi:peptidoglycan/LPS O-acetylase OafA/YrhL